MSPSLHLSPRTISGRLVGALLTLSIGILLVAGVGWVALRTMSSRIVNDLGQLQRSTSLTSGLVATVSDEIRAAEQYLASGDASARTAFKRAADSVHQLEHALRSLPTLSAEDRLTVTRIGETDALVQVAYALAHVLNDLGRTVEAHQQAAVARPRSGELAQLARELEQSQGAAAVAGARDLAAGARRREIGLVLVVLLALIIGGAVTHTTIRSIRGPLDRLVRSAERFSGGDLRPASLGAMPRELETLGGAMTTIGDRLRPVLTEVVAQSDRITGAAGDLSAVSEQVAASSGQVSSAMVSISQGALQQREELARMRDGLGRVRETTSQNAAAAGDVAEVGERIGRLAAEHGASVQTAGQALLDVREVVTESSAHVAQLGDLAGAVDEFVQLVKQVSSQTNLLALNAAIEAARAGEQGRGFAVVADEVRQLADESAQRAEGLAETTAAIRRQVHRVSDTMERGRQIVSGIEQVAQGAVAGLEAIRRDVEQVEQSARRLAQLAEENRATTEALERGVVAAAQAAESHAASAQQVSAASQEQGASTEEMAAAAAELLQSAEKLRGLVSGFRV